MLQHSYICQLAYHLSKIEVIIDLQTETRFKRHISQNEDTQNYYNVLSMNCLNQKPLHAYFLS